MKHNEDAEQISLMTWVKAMANIYPMLKFVYHTPNGGYRDVRVAAKLKAMGTKAGVWDIFVPLPTGLFIEMKIGKNKLTTHQHEFMTGLIDYGYKFAVCYSWHEAALVIAEHIGMEKEHIPQ
jgi:hypothetical protein